MERHGLEHAHAMTSSGDFWTTRAVAVGVFIILSLLLGILCFKEVPKENHDIIITLAGAMAGSAVTIVSFYFGSSSSSRAKDDTIAALAPAKSADDLNTAELARIKANA
jgi:hypothetical protein